LRWRHEHRYLIFYFEAPPLIEIARVIHGKQNVADILEDLT